MDMPVAAEGAHTATTTSAIVEAVHRSSMPKLKPSPPSPAPTEGTLIEDDILRRPREADAKWQLLQVAAVRVLFANDQVARERSDLQSVAGICELVAECDASEVSAREPREACRPESGSNLVWVR